MLSLSDINSKLLIYSAVSINYSRALYCRAAVGEEESTYIAALYFTGELLLISKSFQCAHINQPVLFAASSQNSK